MNMPDRSQLHFTTKVRKAFSFLANEGFTEVEALPTLVRYQKGGVEVDVYHGRQSYEIGAGISISGTRYAMSEVVRAGDPEVAKTYRNMVATTHEGIVAGLEELSALMQRYGATALRGDSRYFSMLEGQRKQWAKEYALDVIESQLRPQAEEAFRRRDYSKVVELYGRIKERLSPVEVKRLALAEKRTSRGRGNCTS
ncbi:hypothetical protein [Pseudoxanthomonas sp. LARHCG66]